MGTIAPEKRSSNEAVYTGEVALDGSNPTPVVTPFNTVTSVALTLGGSSAPGVGTSVLTYAKSTDPGVKTVNIYAWKPTSNSNPTLIASAGTETVSYEITGY